MKHHPATCLCVFGTGSDVGKSVVVAALCRLFRRHGIDVAPFKAQNMSNNSYVTPEGGEMGRAQVVQAEAARVTPHVDMNPVLLKPNTDIGCQVIVHGKPLGNRDARDYFGDTSALCRKAVESLDRLRSQHALIVLEGAGSCAEVNLRSRDFVNFEMAHVSDAPVLLVADIDRGGVFAQIVGTLAVIPPADRARVKGFIINKFRGDASLFADGIRYLEQQTGLPVLGLIPYFRHIEIDSEDGMPLETVIDPPTGPVPGKINLAAIRLPHISNFTDFNPLQREAAVAFHYLAKPRALSGYDVVFLPGSKNVRGDMDWFAATGWRERLLEYVRGGGRVFGLCGGFQMLGRTIHDPHGVEGAPGTTATLGLLPAETVLHREKVVTRSTGQLVASELAVEGYEIHMGETALDAGAIPMIRGTSRNREPVVFADGAVSPDGRVCGTYFHGIFDAPAFRRCYLRSIAPDTAVGDAEHARDFKERQYDLLAEHFEQHLDLTELFALAHLPPPA